MKKINDLKNINDQIDSLEMSPKLKEKLKNKGLNVIKDIWVLKRKDLKEMGFVDSEIKSIIISLQLQGLDLNMKIYD